MNEPRTTYLCQPDRMLRSDRGNFSQAQRILRRLTAIMSRVVSDHPHTCQSRWPENRPSVARVSRTGDVGIITHIQERQIRADCLSRWPESRALVAGFVWVGVTGIVTRIWAIRLKFKVNGVPRNVRFARMVRKITLGR